MADADNSTTTKTGCQAPELTSCSTTLDFALAYIKKGWSLFPGYWEVEGKGKKVVHSFLPWKRYEQFFPTELEIRSWINEWPNANLFIVTGALSQIIVIDIDDPRLLEVWGLENVPRVATGRGFHLYFKHPGIPLRNQVQIQGQSVDLRAEGGCACAPPSLHPSGKRYSWIISPDGDLPEIPTWLIELLRDKEQSAPKAIPGTIPEGTRHTTLVSLAGSMRRRGASEAAIQAALQAENTKCNPPLSEKDIKAIAGSISRYPSPEDGQKNYNLTDLGNAERLLHQFGENIRYCYERKLWLIWNGKHWGWDYGSQITEMASQMVRTIYAEAAAEPDKERRQAILDHARRSESNTKINALKELAQAFCPVSVNDLDQQPYLFSVQNGTLNLSTGQLHPHRREDLLTFSVQVDYDEQATCPLWERFLDRIMASDAGLITYLQQAVGYSLTASVKHQLFFLLHGIGANGKSTFVNTIRKILGQYGERLDKESITAAKLGQGPKEALADLKGKRFVLCTELEEGQFLAMSLIKDLTGGEGIKADRKYEHYVSFPATWKLWLMGNHKPVITDTTVSAWRRVRLIPFQIVIPRDEQDLDLVNKLEAELPGILTWAVRGCLSEAREGLREPKAVLDATLTYQKEEDTIAAFLSDRCIVNKEYRLVKGDMRKAYDAWCVATGSRPMGPRAFKRRLLEKGLGESKVMSNRYWEGVGFKEDEELPGLQKDEGVVDDLPF